MIFLLDFGADPDIVVFAVIHFIQANLKKEEEYK
jgi:hypothetical protein